jgi:hypothetical protein
MIILDMACAKNRAKGAIGVDLDTASEANIIFDYFKAYL